MRRDARLPGDVSCCNVGDRNDEKPTSHHKNIGKVVTILMMTTLLLVMVLMTMMTMTMVMHHSPDHDPCTDFHDAISICSCQKKASLIQMIEQRWRYGGKSRVQVGGRVGGIQLASESGCNVSPLTTFRAMDCNCCCRCCCCCYSICFSTTHPHQVTI